MGVEADVAAQEMGAFSATRQRRREHPMRSGRQQAAHARPAPTTMPRAVDQDVICHCGVLLANVVAAIRSAPNVKATMLHIAASRRHVAEAPRSAKSVFRTGSSGRR